MTEKNSKGKVETGSEMYFSELSLAVIVSSFFLRQCSQLDDGLGFLEIKKTDLGYLSLGSEAPLGGTDTC